jgi:hypothetical protein
MSAATLKHFLQLNSQLTFLPEHQLQLLPKIPQLIFLQKISCRSAAVVVADTAAETFAEYF